MGAFCVWSTKLDFIIITSLFGILFFPLKLLLAFFYCHCLFLAWDWKNVTYAKKSSNEAEEFFFQWHFHTLIYYQHSLTFYRIIFHPNSTQSMYAHRPRDICVLLLFIGEEIRLDFFAKELTFKTIFWDSRWAINARCSTVDLRLIFFFFSLARSSVKVWWVFVLKESEY